MAQAGLGLHAFAADLIYYAESLAGSEEVVGADGKRKKKWQMFQA